MTVVYQRIARRRAGAQLRSNLAGLMGRAAVHSGQIITWEQATTSNFQFCANIDRLTPESPAPVQPDAEGRYPAPVPGSWTEM